MHHAGSKMPSVTLKLDCQDRTIVGLFYLLETCIFLKIAVSAVKRSKYTNLIFDILWHGPTVQLV